MMNPRSIDAEPGWYNPFWWPIAAMILPFQAGKQVVDYVRGDPEADAPETRPPNVEGEGEVTTFDLVRNALRMRPDRIIVGESRGPEALDMMQAMNTGHEGSMTTIHANSPRDSMDRLEMMVGMAGYDIPIWVIRRQISSAIPEIWGSSSLISIPHWPCFANW